MSDFINQLHSMKLALDRTTETLGVPYADPFNEEGFIADVNDPDNLGRVKVTTDDGFVSDWIPVEGSSKGRLSAKYIGATVIISKTNGRSENMYVTSIRSKDRDLGIIGTPLQLPIIDESMAVWNGSSDAGMQCNENNEGRAYVLSNEISQDAVICLRRSSPQVGSKPSWAWKSLTNGLWVEKGINPGNSTTQAISQSQKSNPGIPKCSESLLGEVHDFTEDRGFRTFSVVCRRDEDGNFSWLPLSSPPVFFRTTLPKCSEKTHGMSAILDDGNNSEHLSCQRYQGSMKWVRQASRIPHKFYGKEKPLSRIQFLSRFNPIPALEEKEPSVFGYDWAKQDSVRDVVLDTVVSAIPLTGTDPKLKAILTTAGKVPASAFDGADVIARVSRAALREKTGIPVDTILDEIVRATTEDSDIDSAILQVLNGTGDAANVLINGVRAGTVDDALERIGQRTLQAALSSLDSRAASVFTGLMSGGVWGAVDSAVAVGLDQLPESTNKYVKPLVELAVDILKEYPKSVGDLLNSAVSGGLLSVVSGDINKAIGFNVVTPGLISTLGEGLISGTFGDVGKLFGSVGNLSAVSKLPPELGSLPTLATTALGVIGQSGAITNLLGKGGVGFDSVASMVGGGFNPAATILGGVKGLGGVFNGGGDGCPCDPKCRKTSHGEDSDGNNLIDPCGALTANNANSATPTGDPLSNNIGPIAKSLGLKPTGIGENLVLSGTGIRDLSAMIKTVRRAKDMAGRFYDSRFADQVERMVETAYTFEAVEKALKTADNNITRVESVERKLIDSMYNMLVAIAYKRKGKRGLEPILPQLIRDVKENSKAIKDLYAFTKRLDLLKSGKRVGVRVTPNLAAAFQNIPDLTSLLALNRKQALRILRGGIIPADREWRTMNPGLGFKSTLGVYSGTIPDPYSKERTLFDKNRVLAISAESKITDDDLAEPSLLDSILSPDQIEAMKSGESSLYDAIVGREGQTDCN